LDFSRHYGEIIKNLKRLMKYSKTVEVIMSSLTIYVIVAELKEDVFEAEQDAFEIDSSKRRGD
jgi:hypothetical protein